MDPAVMPEEAVETPVRDAVPGLPGVPLKGPQAAGTSDRVAGFASPVPPAADPRPRKPLSLLGRQEIEACSYLDLLLSLFEEFPAAKDGLSAAVLQRDLFRMIISVALRSSPSGSEEKAIEAINHQVFRLSGTRVLCGETPGIDLILPHSILREGVGCPVGVAMLYLAIAEGVKPDLRLKPVPLAGDVALRWEGDGFRRNIVLSEKGRLRPDKDLVGGSGARAPKLVAVGKVELVGVVLAALGRAVQTEPERSLRYTRLAAELHPEMVEPHLLLARVAAEELDWTTARKEAEVVLRLDPGNPDALTLRALAFLNAGEDDLAERDLEEIVSDPLAPSQAVITLAEIREGQGRFEEARSLYRRQAWLAEDPQEKQALELRLRELEARRPIEVLQARRDYGKMFSAVKVLAERPVPQGVEALIEALSDENIRFRYFVGKALREITGEVLPPDRAAWSDWWAAHRERFSAFPEGRPR